MFDGAMADESSARDPVSKGYAIRSPALAPFGSRSRCPVHRQRAFRTISRTTGTKQRRPVRPALSRSRCRPWWPRRPAAQTAMRSTAISPWCAFARVESVDVCRPRSCASQVDAGGREPTCCPGVVLQKHWTILTRTSRR